MHLSQSSKAVSAASRSSLKLFLIGLLVFDLFFCLSYYLAGHNLIEAMYQGKSLSLLNRMIEGQADHPLKYYFQFADQTVFHFLIALNLTVVTGIGLWVFFVFMGVRKLAYLMAVTILSFLTLEISLRFLEPLNLKKSIYYNDKDLGIRVQPFKMGSNSLGFNDKDYPTTKNGSVIRIVGLGDSFNWTGGYENNYWTLAEELLQTARGVSPTVEILNQGIPGIGPAYLFKLLQKVSMKFKPDIVMLAFFVGNDFWDSDKNVYPAARFSYPFYYPLYTKQKRGPLLVMERDVYSYFLVKMLVFRWTDFYLRVKEQKRGEGTGTFSRKNFLRIEEGRIAVCLEDFYKSEAWQQTQQQILDFRDYLRNKKAAFYMVILPDQYQVDRALREEVFESQAFLPKRNYDFELPQKKLKRFLEDHEIEYVDLLPSFKEASQGVELYESRDTHFNREGNLLAAQIVAGFIQEKLRRQTGERMA